MVKSLTYRILSNAAAIAAITIITTTITTR